MDLAYVNFAHGGDPHGDSFGTSGTFVMDGLVEMMGDDDRWPDAFVLGEPERWGFNGQDGKCAAEVALNKASGRAYTIELGTLPRDWGPIGPALVYDAATVHRHRFFSGHEPDFYARNRNLAILSHRQQPDLKIHVVGYHGDLNSGLYRLLDVMAFRRYANPAVPTVILGDWNANLSGEQWDFPEDFALFEHTWQYASRALWPDEIPMPGPVSSDTRSMDYLCGKWIDGRRVGGVGFVHIGEQAGVTTPTQYPAPNGRHPRQVDGGFLNASAAPMLIPSSVHVHEPADPADPPSDHKRFSFTLDLTVAPPGKTT